MENRPSAKGRATKSRLVPEVYFLPRRPHHVTLAIYGSITLAGVGAGMLVEQWINARVLEDGGYVTLGTKKEEQPAVSHQAALTATVLCTLTEPGWEANFRDEVDPKEVVEQIFAVKAAGPTATDIVVEAAIAEELN
ncbi:hypothetical protein R1sor_005206 [Riccia sorocarpa]|uniref:Uncharacterized protein n=1 Tax=Riccia sorocarpa TaxID=122646 RepID=A0ABD3HMP9_9MARC